MRPIRTVYRNDIEGHRRVGRADQDRRHDEMIERFHADKAHEPAREKQPCKVCQHMPRRARKLASASFLFTDAGELVLRVLGFVVILLAMWALVM